MAALYSASVRGRIATASATRCINLGGLSLHANVSVPAGDRQRLERLCRYLARPPVATERLTRLSDGRLMYELRHPWRDGTTHVAFLPLELMEKLAALVPPPRVNLVRYHGVLAPAARHRSEVVPVVEKSDDLESVEKNTDARSRESEAEKSKPRPRNYSWAELMRRVFSPGSCLPPDQGRPSRIESLHIPYRT